MLRPFVFPNVLVTLYTLPERAHVFQQVIPTKVLKYSMYVRVGTVTADVTMVAFA